MLTERKILKNPVSMALYAGSGRSRTTTATDDPKNFCRLELPFLAILALSSHHHPPLYRLHHRHNDAVYLSFLEYRFHDQIVKQ